MHDAALPVDVELANDAATHAGERARHFSQTGVCEQKPQAGVSPCADDTTPRLEPGFTKQARDPPISRTRLT